MCKSNVFFLRQKNGPLSNAHCVNEKEILQNFMSQIKSTCFQNEIQDPARLFFESPLMYKKLSGKSADNSLTQKKL